MSQNEESLSDLQVDPPPTPPRSKFRLVVGMEPTSDQAWGTACPDTPWDPEREQRQVPV